jgi:hypothetical protein
VRSTSLPLAILLRRLNWVSGITAPVISCLWYLFMMSSASSPSCTWYLASCVRGPHHPSILFLLAPRHTWEPGRLRGTTLTAGDRLVVPGLCCPGRSASASLMPWMATLAEISQSDCQSPIWPLRIESLHRRVRKKKKKLSACRGEGSVVGLQLRVRFVPAALLAMLRTALALQAVRLA